MKKNFSKKVLSGLTAVVLLWGCQKGIDKPVSADEIVSGLNPQKRIKGF
jgi:hypothetical protein